MAVHFGENAGIGENKEPKDKITLDECVSAMRMLDDAERRMHYALSFDGNNPLAVVSKKLVRFIKAVGSQTTRELQAQFWDDVRGPELNEILDHLQRQNKITLDEDKVGVKKWKLI